MLLHFAGEREREGEHKARGEGGARVTRVGIRTQKPLRVTRAPPSPRALCSPSRSPTKRKNIAPVLQAIELSDGYHICTVMNCNNVVNCNTCRAL